MDLFIILLSAHVSTTKFSVDRRSLYPTERHHARRNGGQCTPHRGPSRRNKTVSINTITLPECRHNDVRAVFWRANFNERLVETLYLRTRPKFILVRSSCVTCIKKWHVSASGCCWSMVAAASRESVCTRMQNRIEYNMKK